MEKVINLLNDIEEKANHILDRAAEEKKSLNQQMNQKLAQLDASIDAETKTKLDALKARMDNEVALETKVLIEKSNEQLKEMEDSFRKKHDTLADEIFRQIIAE